MNWLGGGPAAFLAAALGALLGAIVQFEARRRGMDVAPIVGLLAGLGAALASRDKSALRAALVASLSVWSAAVAEVLAAPARGVIQDIAAFHLRMELVSTLSLLACALLGAAVGSRALRPTGCVCAERQGRAPPAKNSTR